jgi:hypothetical protein
LVLGDVKENRPIVEGAWGCQALYISVIYPYRKSGQKETTGSSRTHNGPLVSEALSGNLAEHEVQTEILDTSANAYLILRIWRSVFPAPLRPRNRKGSATVFTQQPDSAFPAAYRKRKNFDLTLSWGLGGMAATLVHAANGHRHPLEIHLCPHTGGRLCIGSTIIVQPGPFRPPRPQSSPLVCQFLVVVLMLHMLRVFFTGAFHGPRQFNWIIGLALFAMVLAANLSGYLLPYDQLAYWAVTVVTAMIGYIPGIGDWLQQALGNGTELGPRTLPFFYTMHTAVIPILLAGLMGFHFWRIRKAGGLVVPRETGSEPVDEMPVRVPVVPQSAGQRSLHGIGVDGTVLVFSIFFDAALRRRPIRV